MNGQGPPFDLVQPELTILHTPPNVVISWDASTVWQLEYTEVLGSGIWNNVTETPVVAGNHRTVTAPALAMPRFYHLRR